MQSRLASDLWTEIMMGTAKAFKPGTILVRRKVQRHSETERILRMFPEARVEIAFDMGQMLDSLALDHVSLLAAGLVLFLRIDRGILYDGWQADYAELHALGFD
jgi:hypothetical protein